MPSFWNNEADGISSRSLVPHIQQIMEQSLRQSHCRLEALGSPVLLSWSWADTSRVHLIVFWTFPMSHNIGQQCHCHCPHQITACHLSSRKWPPHQAWCHPYPLESLICHSWAELFHYTWGKHSFSRPPVSQWCHCILWTNSLHCKHVMELLPIPPRHTAQGYLSDFLGTSRPTPETRSFSCWHNALDFPCQPSMPWAWRFTPLGCPWWAPGHQCREAPMAHQRRTHAKVGIGLHTLDDICSPFLDTEAP